MVDKLLGMWKLEKNENFDEYMKTNKVNVVLRKVGNTITSYENIKRDGDNWVIDITSTFRSTKLEFKIGEPFTEHTMDGRTMKSTFTIEDTKLVCQHEPINDKDIPSRFEREVLEDGKMVLTCIGQTTPENVIAKRYFQVHKS